MTDRLIVGLHGRKRSGKGEVASRFMARGFALLKFADPLKAMLQAFGLSQAEIDGDLKEAPCDKLCGRTPRWAMQSIGTEWGRVLIADGLWLDHWRRRVAALPAGQPVVVDDVRFPNEAELVRSLGGVIVTITRPGAGGADGHESEAHTIVGAHSFVNRGTLADMHAAADRLVSHIMRNEQERIDRSWAEAAAADFSAASVMSSSDA